MDQLADDPQHAFRPGPNVAIAQLKIAVEDSMRQKTHDTAGQGAGAKLGAALDEPKNLTAA